MSQVINTNVMSLNAQRNLNQSQGALAQSLERLSSGLRINSAKDDAAGLAISERFTSQINGLDQAVRNSNDGISLAQTAEGALDTVSDSLQRARELAVQAANDSNSASDRQALNDEVQQLMDEVGRIANNTEFNGGRILDGSVEDLFFQVGANQGQMIGVDGVDARNTNLGAAEVVGDGALDSSQLEELAGFSDSDVTITVDGADDPIEVALDGDDIQTMDDAVRAINSAISEAATEDDVISDASLEAALRVNNEGETSISITGAFDTGFTVDGGQALDEDGDDLGAALFDNQGDINNGGDNNVNLTEIDVTTRDTATQAIGVMDGALTQISSLRSELGAVQTRFESTISNLEIGSENLSDARSRIMDADFAAETAELTRAEVLQQAGTSVLSQANAVPQNVLGLLQ
ncbi:flagellin [Thioalkalivibrio sp. ALE21]|uniref:flagellin n=1 Tax=Thioalkalivibrio sp. ALE21 TaxID=1158175 RepID=UPI000D862622|nr:flagellin [Thioalkalivibrio sp. ALE21]PYG03850.1 flagellin [Thioalkalivibrio sp. ALE21]